MANAFQVNVSTVVGGLGTQTYTVPAGVATQIYTLAVNFTIPYRAAGTPGDSTVTTGGSGLQIVVNKNGSAALTISGPAPTQPSMAGSVRLSLAAADVVTVVLSSSAAVDAAPNAVKGTINFYMGE